MNEITTSRLYLRNIIKSDDKDIFEYSRNPNIGPNAGWKPHESINETRKIMKAVFLNQPYCFGIILPENGKLIGTVGLVQDQKREFDKAMMLGYSLSEDYHGKGYMTEAAQAVIKYGFENVKLKLISAYCYPFNKASQRVIEKCGFMYEGTLKMAELRFDGVLLDEICYSISREEYFQRNIV